MGARRLLTCSNANTDKYRSTLGDGLRKRDLEQRLSRTRQLLLRLRTAQCEGTRRAPRRVIPAGTVTSVR